MFLKTSLFDEEFFQHFACKALQGKEYKKKSILYDLFSNNAKTTWSACCVTSNISDPLIKDQAPGTTVWSVCLPT